jgi:Second Messenger Oligonucleotide or Dinucleotide Synthetase domain
MPLSNAQLHYYDSNILRLPREKRTEYHNQVDRLIENLKENIKTHPNINLKKVVKSGSFGKHTILRKTSNDPVDVDVVFYLSELNENSETFESLSEIIHQMLIDIYPTKKVGDFEIQRKAATVNFIGSGLSVDVVPVIENLGNPDYGWQYDIKDGSRVQTCAPCQIKFVRERKKADRDFRTLVRLAKKWRNHSGLSPLKSFTIELILAHVLETQGNNGSIEQRFRNFLLYIAQSELRERIVFPENCQQINFSHPVVIIDPVCDSNNVASRITEKERQTIVATATEAWEIANFASAENDLRIWKEIFGPRFKVED